MAHTRTVALFPGSFKPPHLRHLEVVQHLLARPDVDEVTIIISRRGRSLPGTNLALGVDAALAVWRILLGDTPRVSIAVARNSAIDDVRSRVEACAEDSRWLLCVGAEDLSNGDRRFDELLAAARARGIAAEVVGIPASRHGVRATQVRACLAAGPAGRREFGELFGDSVSGADQERIWLACVAAARPLAAFAAETVSGVLEQRSLHDGGALELVDGAPGRVTFTTAAADGRRLLLKHAGDEIGGEPHGRPRHRLATERRALTYLRSALPVPHTVPEVAFYDEPTRTLGVWLPAQAPADGSDNAETLMLSAARWLAALHALPAPARALRGTVERERTWWDSRLEEISRPVPPGARNWLLGAARTAATPGVFHLAFGVDAVRALGAAVLVTNFEDASSFGDPAFDLGCLAASCMARGVAAGASAAAANALRERLVGAYAATARGDDAGVLDRARWFAAAKMSATTGSTSADLGEAWMATARRTQLG